MEYFTRFHQFPVLMQQKGSETCVGVTYLKGTIHHTNDVIKLLVVQYGAVLLNVKT